MERNWGIDLFRSFFAMIDKAVYSLIDNVYKIILDLATEVSVFSPGLIDDMYKRIYALLAIFMLFKVTFSFINYVINPDAFLDKSKGVQNLIKNFIIVLVMIIITPFAFSKLYEAQEIILEDNLIPNFILGVNSTSSSDKNLEGSFQMSDKCPAGIARTDGDYLALVTLRPFYQLEENIGVNEAGRYCEANSMLTPKFYLKREIYNATRNGQYIVDYKILLSSAVGVFVCLILISFCFDIAIRTIKLGFLQMIAPIPIISYIDPASGKNGMFSKWLKQVGSTWASLFIRLAAIFFAILIVSEIEINVGDSQYKFWVMLFILIGALMFAKQLPKLLEELIPGLKLGGMQLNPFKKVANDALGGKELLGLTTSAAGLAVGGLAQATSNLYAFHKNKDSLQKAFDSEKDVDKKAKLGRELASYNFMRSIGTTLGGFGGGAYRGMTSGFKTGMSGKINILGNLNADLKSGNTARNNRSNINRYNREVDYQRSAGNITNDEWKNQRYGFYERNVEERLDRNFGIKNEHGGYGYYDKQINDLKNKIDNLNQTEQSIRTSLSQKTQYFAQLLEINDMISKGTSRNDAIQKVSRNSGINMSDLANDYLANERELKNINYVDAQQKELKAKKKNYEEMMSARQEVKK